MRVLIRNSAFLLTLFSVTTSCTFFSHQSSQQLSGYSSSIHGLRVHILNPFDLKLADTLAVYLHGDTPGNEGEYMLYAARKVSLPNLVSAAIIRPGYRDSGGNFSSGSTNGERDNYSGENLEAIWQVIRKLKTDWGARKLVLVGHSGGAAIAANLAGLHSKEIRGLVLISCPCDVHAWHPDWTQSLSPLDFVDRYSKDVKVIALTGEDDIVTPPHFAESFIIALRKRGLTHLEMRAPKKMGHNFIMERPEVIDAITDLVK